MRLRAATLDDAPVVAVVHRQSVFISLPFLPDLHTREEDLRFVRDRLMSENTTWVAEVDGVVVGYIAFNDDWITHLFVHPDHQGRGHGPALLAHAMADGRARQLWTFQRNTRARKFYEDRGWVLAELTDGQGNEEKEPDVRYVWPGAVASEGE